jgi:hypothetical protein
LIRKNRVNYHYVRNVQKVMKVANTLVKVLDQAAAEDDLLVVGDVRVLGEIKWPGKASLTGDMRS